MNAWFKHTKWTKKMRYLPVWNMDRQAMAKGIAAGLLVCFLPVPGQTVLAAFLVYLIRGNLPAAILATWVSNPITFLPINLLICAIGAWVMNEQAALPTYLPSLSWSDIYAWIASLSKAYLVGLPILSLNAALLGYVLAYVCWPYITSWKKTVKTL